MAEEEEQLAAGGTSRSWVIDSHGHVHCFRSPRGDCHVFSATDGGGVGGDKFLKANASGPYQDDELMGVTDELNGLLEGVLERNRDRSEELAILRSSRGLFLAWVTCDEAIGADDTEALEEWLGY